MAGCAQPLPRAALPETASIIPIAEPEGFLVSIPETERRARGFFGGDGLTIIDGADGLPDPPRDAAPLVLRLEPGPNLPPSGRVVEVPLLSAPYLRFRQRQAPLGQDGLGPPPLTILVGFSGTDAPRPGWLDERGLPFAERILVIRWHDQPDLPQHFTSGEAVAGLSLPMGSIVGDWWEEVLDLLTVHETLWPAHPPQDARVRFVAFDRLPGGRPAVADIAGLWLSR